MAMRSDFPPRGAILVSAITCILLRFASGRPLCDCENERPWHMSPNYGPYVAEKGHAPFSGHSPHYFNVDGHPPLAPNYHFPGWHNGEFSLKHKTPGYIVENPSEPDVVLPCGEKVPYALYESCIECYKKNLPLEIVTSCGDVIPVSSYTELLLATKGNPEIRIQLPNGVIVSAGTYRALVSGYVDKTLAVQYPENEYPSPVPRTIASDKKVREPTVIMPSGERLSYKVYENIVRSNEERTPLRVLTPTEEKIVCGLTELILATQGRPFDLVLLNNGAIVTSKVFRDVINTRLKKNAVLILPSGLSMPLNSETLIPADELPSGETPNGHSGVLLPNGEEISQKVYDSILNSETNKLPKCVIKPSGEMIVVTTLPEILRATENGPYDVIELNDGAAITPGTYESAVRLSAEKKEISASQEVSEPSFESEPEREVSVVLHGGLELPYDVYEAIMETYIHRDRFVVTVAGKAVPVGSLLELIAVTHGNPNDVITLPNGMHLRSSTFRGVINEHQQNDIFLRMPSGEMIPLSKGYDDYIHAVHMTREHDSNSSPKEGFVTVGSGEKIAFPLYETIISSSCNGKPIFVLDPDGSVLTVRTLPDLWQLVDRHPDYLIRLPGEILVPADTYRQAVHSRQENAEILALVCGSNGIKPLSDSTSVHSVVVLSDQETIPYHLYRSIVNSYENRTPLKTTTLQAQYVYVYPLVELMLVTQHRPNALVFLQNGDVTTAHTYRDAVITHTQGSGKLLNLPEQAQPEPTPVTRCQAGHDRCNFVRITVPGRGVQFILGDGSWDSPKYCRIECEEGKFRYQPADPSLGLPCYESLVRPDGKVVYVEAQCPQSTQENGEGEKDLEPALEQQSSKVTEETPEHKLDTANPQHTEAIHGSDIIHTLDIHRPSSQEESKAFSEEPANQIVTDSSNQLQTTDVADRPVYINEPSSIAIFEELPCQSESEESNGEPKKVEVIDGFGQLHTVDIGDQPVSITKFPCFVTFPDTPSYDPYPKLTEKEGPIEQKEHVAGPSVEPYKAVPEEPNVSREGTPESLTEPSEEISLPQTEHSKIIIGDAIEPSEDEPQSSSEPSQAFLEEPNEPCEDIPEVLSDPYSVSQVPSTEPSEMIPGEATEPSEEPRPSVEPFEVTPEELTEPSKVEPQASVEPSEVFPEELTDPCENIPEPLSKPYGENSVPKSESSERSPGEETEPCEDEPQVSIQPEATPKVPTVESSVPLGETAEMIPGEVTETSEDEPQSSSEPLVLIPEKSAEPCKEAPVNSPEPSEVILEERTEACEDKSEPLIEPSGETPVPSTEPDVIPEVPTEPCVGIPESFKVNSVTPNQPSEITTAEAIQPSEIIPKVAADPSEDESKASMEYSEIVPVEPTEPCEDKSEPFSETTEPSDIRPTESSEVIPEEQTDRSTEPETLFEPSEQSPEEPINPFEYTPERPTELCVEGDVPPTEPSVTISEEGAESTEYDPQGSIEPPETISEEVIETCEEAPPVSLTDTSNVPEEATEPEGISEEATENGENEREASNKSEVIPEESTEESHVNTIESSDMILGETTQPSEDEPEESSKPSDVIHEEPIEPCEYVPEPLSEQYGQNPVPTSGPSEMIQDGTETSEDEPQVSSEPFEVIPEGPSETCEDTPKPTTEPYEVNPLPSTEPSLMIPGEASLPSEAIAEESNEPCEDTLEPLEAPFEEISLPPTAPSEIIPGEGTESFEDQPPASTEPCDVDPETLTAPSEEIPAPSTEPSEVIPTAATEPNDNEPQAVTVPFKVSPEDLIEPYEDTLDTSEENPSPAAEPLEVTPGEVTETSGNEPEASTEPYEIIPEIPAQPYEDNFEPSKEPLTETSEVLPEEAARPYEVISEESTGPPEDEPQTSTEPFVNIPEEPTETSEDNTAPPIEASKEIFELNEPIEENPFAGTEREPSEIFFEKPSEDNFLPPSEPLKYPAFPRKEYEHFPEESFVPGDENPELMKEPYHVIFKEPTAPRENNAELPSVPYEETPVEPGELSQDSLEQPSEPSNVISEEPPESCKTIPEDVAQPSGTIRGEATESSADELSRSTKPSEVIPGEQTEPSEDTPEPLSEPCESFSDPESSTTSVEEISPPSTDSSSVKPHAVCPHGEGSFNKERYHFSRSLRKHKRRRKPSTKKHEKPMEEIIQELPEVRPTYTPVYDDNDQLVSFVRSDLLTDNDKCLPDANAPVDPSCKPDSQPHILINTPNKVVHDNDGNMFVLPLKPDGSVAYDSESIVLKPVPEEGGSASPTGFHFQEIEDCPCPSSDPGYIIVRTPDGHINYVPSVAAPGREITLPSGKKFVVPVFPSKFLEPSVPYHAFTTPDGYIHEVPYGRGYGDEVESSMISIEKIETADGSTVEIPVETKKRCDGSITTSVTYSPNGKTKYKTIVDVSGDVYSIPISGSTTHLHPHSKPYKTIIDLKGDEYHVPEGQIKSSAYKTIIDLNGNIYEIPANMEPVDNINQYHNSPPILDPSIPYPELAAIQHNPDVHSFSSKDYLNPFFYPKSYYPSQIPYYDRVMAHIYQGRSFSDQPKPCASLSDHSGTPLTVVPFDDHAPEDVPHYYYPPHPLLYNYRHVPVPYHV